MTPYGFIYITTNNLNGKRYLGMCAYHRPNHKAYLGSGKALKRAIRKYGSEHFSRIIIEECLTKDDMIAAEVRHIKELNCVNDKSWYNINHGGFATRGFSGRKHSEETKKRMRENYKRPLTEETIKKFKLNGLVRVKHLEKFKDVQIRAASRPIIFESVSYPSIKKCCEDTGYDRNYIQHSLRKPPKAIILDGVEYPSISVASSLTGIHCNSILKLLRSKDRRASYSTNSPVYCYITVEKPCNE